jgi:hypothetical protein
VRDSFYILGSVVGPHPYPAMVRDFQSVIGEETKRQLLEREGREVPDAVVACVGGGSNAIGIFAPYAYLPDGERPRLIGVEAAGEGVDTGRHAASVAGGKVGVLHGAKMYLLFDEDGQIVPAHSISAGLDYPGIGPEHSWYASAGVAEYVPVTDDEALAAFRAFSRTEGIIPALETAHAIAHVMKLAPTMRPDEIIVVNLSGRGDKDATEAMRLLAREHDFEDRHPDAVRQQQALEDHAHDEATRTRRSGRERFTHEPHPRHLPPRQGGGPRRLRRVPPRRISRRGVLSARGDDPARTRRPARDRPAVLRSARRRPDHPAGQRGGPAGRRDDPQHLRRGEDAARTDRQAARHHDVLQPHSRVGRGALRA